MLQNIFFLTIFKNILLLIIISISKLGISTNEQKKTSGSKRNKPLKKKQIYNNGNLKSHIIMCQINVAVSSTD